ncbi:MAG TPA: pseudouridine synthase [Terriglobales bacterium]|nr:pseudouridine synthase [Terriglobales bacterium]
MKSQPRKIGLARALSKLGYCSRSQATALIRQGRVTLNGTPRRDPEFPVQSDKDRIQVDGRTIGAEKKIYLVMHKPRGVVTTAKDEEGRKTVYDLLGGKQGWIAPVGRLDKASEGLLLLTNDSEWAAQVTAPETHLDKVYHVRVDANADDRTLHLLLEGVRTSDGELLRAKAARRIRGGERRCWIEIVLDEGKNRQIRRMFESLGLEVLRLVRVAIGPLTLGKLTKGEVRPLSKSEKQQLDNAMRRKQ